MQHLTAQAHLSRLIVVDMQTRLLAAMPSDSVPMVVKNCAILLQTAQLLDIPRLVSEHYSKGLGGTVDALNSHLQDTPHIEKTSFACTDTPAFNKHLSQDRPQMILVGMEAHICLLQTALGLLQKGFEVFVVEDAILSRKPAHQANAIARLRAAGCIITTAESVLFEWLQNANHPQFKAISALVK